MYERLYFDGWQKFPYDRSPDGSARQGDWAVMAARGVLNNLCDRRDIKRGFEGVDHDVRKEIVDTLAEIIRIAAAPDAMACGAPGWQPIETAPSMTDVLVWWPLVQLDDDGDPTEEVTGGGAFVSELQGSYWIEPDALNATGNHMGDDETYADGPSHWMPLPDAPVPKGCAE